MTSPAEQVHEMPAEAAQSIVAAIRTAGVDVVVAGGWAVDALLGQQSRTHADLDLWLPVDHLEHLTGVAAAIGIDRLYPWGVDRPWNFVLHDGDRLRIDLHLYEALDTQSFHYGSATSGETFPAEALGGEGLINGTKVRCEAPEWLLRWHTGYPLRPVDRHDVPRLCAHFGLELPAECQ